MGRLKCLLVLFLGLAVVTMANGAYTTSTPARRSNGMNNAPVPAQTQAHSAGRASSITKLVTLLRAQGDRFVDQIDVLGKEFRSELSAHRNDVLGTLQKQTAAMKQTYSSSAHNVLDRIARLEKMVLTQQAPASTMLQPPQFRETEDNQDSANVQQVLNILAAQLQERTDWYKTQLREQWRNISAELRLYEDELRDIVKPSASAAAPMTVKPMASTRRNSFRGLPTLPPQTYSSYRNNGATRYTAPLDTAGGRGQIAEPLQYTLPPLPQQQQQQQQQQLPRQPRQQQQQQARQQQQRLASPSSFVPYPSQLQEATRLQQFARALDAADDIPAPSDNTMQTGQPLPLTSAPSPQAIQDDGSLGMLQDGMEGQEPPLDRDLDESGQQNLGMNDSIHSLENQLLEEENRLSQMPPRQQQQQQQQQQQTQAQLTQPPALRRTVM